MRCRVVQVAGRRLRILRGWDYFLFEGRIYVCPQSTELTDVGVAA